MIPGARPGRIGGALVLLIVIACSIALAPAAEAVETDTFRVEPWPLRVDGYERRSFDYDIEPGVAVTDAFRITNKTDEPKRFRIQATDAQRDPAGQISIGGRGSTPQAMGTWITLERDEVEVGPGSSEVVSFRFERPSEQHVEGFGAIAVEELREVDGGGVDVVYRLALIARLGGEAPSLHATDPELQIPVRLVPSEGTVSTVLHNDTLERTDAVVRFGVASLTGRTWGLDEVEVSLEPGERRRVEQAWTTVPRWGGILRPELEVTWARGSVVLAGDRGLHPPLWLLALVIVAVGVRGLRELWTQRQERTDEQHEPRPDPDALRGRLIEAALWLQAAGPDVPAELRETTIAEARAVAVVARNAPDVSDIERAARSLEAFARGFDADDASARQAADDFDAWYREHRDDPRVKELVRS